MRWIVDTGATGVRCVLRVWELEAMRLAWSRGEVTVREVWLHVNGELGEGTISRAGVVVFLDGMAMRGVLRRERVPGRGGYRNRYAALVSEPELVSSVAEACRGALLSSSSSSR